MQTADFRKEYRTYELWAAQLDLILIKKCGLDTGCLPDYPTRDAYERGEWPEDTAEDVIENAQDY